MLQTDKLTNSYFIDLDVQCRPKNGGLARSAVLYAFNILFDSHCNVIRYLGELVGAQVELHHVDPGPDVDGKRRELVLLHVQFLQILGSGEYPVRNSKHKVFFKKI